MRYHVLSVYVSFLTMQVNTHGAVWQWESLTMIRGWKLALAHWPLDGKFYVGPVEMLSGLVKCPITINTDIGIWESCQGR